MESKEIVFVVPCYNETLPLTKTIKSLLKYGEVVLVNDGSKKFLNIAPEIYKEINYLHHVINRGQGAALETGFEFIRLYFPTISYIITFDADGQHSLQDALKMVSKARQGYDVVLGSRFMVKNSEISRFKRIILLPKDWLIGAGNFFLYFIEKKITSLQIEILK
jgi:glycosyltransferase involved in cell wall biosynthesis